MTEPLTPSWDRKKASGDGDYYAPVTDLLLGILFIFLILLTFFAAQLQRSAETLTDTTRSRTELLQQLQARLQEGGVTSTIDPEEGVLSLNAAEMFPQGSASLSPEGEAVGQVLAAALSDKLPCFAWIRGADELPECRHPFHSLSTVVIEGHTDSDPITKERWFKDNWDLSAGRASATYRALVTAQPQLGQLLNQDDASKDAQALFAVAGFADERPVAEGTTPEAMARNRRIDVRLIMAPPSAVRLTPLPPHEAAPDTSRPPITLGKDVRFGSRLASSVYLDKGWWPVESWGVWAQAPEATLILPLKTGPEGDLVLRLKGVSFITEDSPQHTYSILLNGKAVDRFRVKHPGNTFTREIPIAAKDVAAGAPLVVTLRTDELVSPLSVGYSTDPRPLGFGLVSLRISAVAAAAD